MPRQKPYAEETARQLLPEAVDAARRARTGRVARALLRRHDAMRKGT